MRSDDLTELYRLQQTQLALQALDRQIKEAPETTALNDLRTRRDKLAKLQTALDVKVKQARRRTRAVELELQTAEDGKKAVHERLYGGAVTGSKELAQLEDRLQSLEHDIAALEETYLKVLDVAEQLHKQNEKVEAAAAQLAAQLRAAQERLAHKEGEWAFQREGLQLDEQDLRAAVDPKLLALYERKQKTTRGEPIAVVRQGVCGGCRMELPAAVRATHGRGLQSCEQCGRLLYWPE